jgi:hypothetical protein
MYRKIVIIWVPDSLVFLIPAATIMLRVLGPQRTVRPLLHREFASAKTR